MHYHLETEMLAIEFDGSIDIVDDVADLDSGHRNPPSHGAAADIDSYETYPFHNDTSTFRIGAGSVQVRANMVLRRRTRLERERWVWCSIELSTITIPTTSRG